MALAETVREMADLIGTTVQVKVGGFQVPMTVTDVKIAYGNKRLLVSPIGGLGQSWVDSARVTINRPVRSGKDSTDKKTTEENVSEAGKVRVWAKHRGIHVNPRGRVPAQIMEEYRKATADQKVSAA